VIGERVQTKNENESDPDDGQDIDLQDERQGSKDSDDCQAGYEQVTHHESVVLSSEWLVTRIVA
jgi:hypothetical protein